MLLDELVERTQNFDQLRPKERILLFAWYLHTFCRKDAFENAEIRSCFVELHLAVPDVSVYLPRMVGVELLKLRSGYKLSRNVRVIFDKKYLNLKSNSEIRQILQDLPASITDKNEREFLNEALRCYRANAYRAAIVMVWNLAYSHLVNWVVSDVDRLNKFNAATEIRFPKKSGLKVEKIDDLENLKEWEAIEIIYSSKLITKNMTEVLREKLKKRNMAAHPSQIVISETQTDDVITDLVNNVVLKI